MTKQLPEISQLPLEYKVNLPFGEHADLSMLFFSHEEHRWIFEYRHHTGEDRDVELLNDYKLVVEYTKGIAGDVVLSMDILFPKRRGQEYFLGVDISKNSRMFIQFRYMRVEGSESPGYQLREFEIGCGKVFSLDSPEAGTVLRPVDFPFEVKDRLVLEDGLFGVPFKLNDNTGYDDFCFPASIVRTYPQVG